MSSEHTRGGSHEQHVKAGQQSHKNSPGSEFSSGSGSKSASAGGSSQGGTHEQHVKAGQQSHKNSK